MAVNDVTQLLAQCPSFRGLQTTDLQAVLQASGRRRVQGNAFFFHQGDPATTFYVLSQGEAKLTQVTPEGHQMLVRFAGPGECFGGIAALMNADYTLSAQAVADCQALTWKGETLAQLMERYPRIALNVMAVQAEQYRQLLDRYQQLLTERVEQRVARTLLRLAGQVGQKAEDGVLIGLPLSREDLAEMTGTTLYTVVASSAVGSVRASSKPDGNGYSSTTPTFWWLSLRICLQTLPEKTSKHLVGLFPAIASTVQKATEAAPGEPTSNQFRRWEVCSHDRLS